MKKRQTDRDQVRVDYPDGTSTIREGYPIRDATHEGWSGDEEEGVASVGVVSEEAAPSSVTVEAPPHDNRRTIPSKE